MIGIIGGSGFEELFSERAQEVIIETPYGPTSDSILLGEFAGQRVAFLRRHGRGHAISAHRINYRANICALKELGVTQILAPFTCGGLQDGLQVGDLVIVDQFVDRTVGRADTFYDTAVVHVEAREPYCPNLRSALRQAVVRKEWRLRRGTVVVVQGPRFSTKAESLWFAREGWDVVNMTQYPECILARERRICYAGIGLVTDTDAGDQAPVSVAAIEAAMEQHFSNLRELLVETLSRGPTDCSHCRNWGGR